MIDSPLNAALSPALLPGASSGALSLGLHSPPSRSAHGGVLSPTETPQLAAGNVPACNLRSVRGGLLLKALLGLGVACLLFAVAWAVLLPGIVAATIHSKTGFMVKIDKLSVNPFTANAFVSGLVVQNPDGWPEKDFVDVRQFRADVQVWPLLTGRFVANEVVADIAAVTVVRNHEGVLNTSAFESGFAGPRTGGNPSGAPGAAPARANGGSRGFLVHRLQLKIDRLVFADYSGPTQLVRTYDLNVDSTMTEVDSVAKIISPLSGAALGVVADALGRINPKDADSLKDAVQKLQSAGKKAGESLKNFFRSLENKKP